jgi:hypothetical protein
MDTAAVAFEWVVVTAGSDMAACALLGDQVPKPAFRIARNTGRICAL